jgi:Domain of unknown function (DUF4340)
MPQLLNKTKKLLIYLCVLVVIAGFWAASQFFWPQKTEEEKNPLLFNLTPGSVLEIQWKRGDEIVQARKEKTWEIRKPLFTSADAGVLEGVLQGLSSLRPERRLADSVNDLKEYGLDNPPLILSFLVQGKWRELRVGAKNPGGNAQYVMTSESPALYLVDQFHLKELDRNVLALRDKRLFSLMLDQVQIIEVSVDDKKYHLEKSSRGWGSQENLQKTLSKEKVDSFLSDLLWTQAKDFAEPGQEDSKWQLDHPKASIRLTGKVKGETPETLLLGSPDSTKGIPGRSSRHKEIIFLDPGFIKKIPESPEVWEEKPAPVPVK